jgi:hypothetical protein
MESNINRLHGEIQNRITSHKQLSAPRDEAPDEDD